MNIAWIFALVIVSPIWTSIVTMLAMPATGLFDHFFNGTDFPVLKILGEAREEKRQREKRERETERERERD
jgi:hypothetical protein